jgi:membrane protein implicated in regulation of membrane protease activity
MNSGGPQCGAQSEVNTAPRPPWRHGVLPWIGTLALLPVLWVTVYPIPPWPYRITPYLFIAALIVGFGYMVWREKRNPGALKRRATALVGRPADAEGDVDWDTRR